MSWKRHLRVVSPAAQQQKLPADNGVGGASGTSSKFSSYLPEVYAGHPNRIQRYGQFDDMDRDSDVAIALDTIADFCTQSEEQAEEPFLIDYNGEVTETETRLLSETLTKWVKLNDFKSRLWQTFRNTIKNGDAFFLRDPETGEWLWIDHYTVEMIKVSEEDGKDPQEYFIRALDYARQQKFASNAVDPSTYRTPYGTASGGGRPNAAPYVQTANVFSLAGANRDPRTMRMMSGQQNELHAVDADHVIHLSLSVAMDINWPFGQSILEQVYKVYKQRELIEDAVLIYRVQRAPERRIFYIDTGAMPPPRAKAHIEQIKNEIHQRRIPNRTGGGASILDAAYNPLGMVEDFFFAQGENGRGSKVETLPGGELVGEIGDLLHFSRKLARGLRVPPSYLSLGAEESQVAYNDGKLGQAMIQEFRFSKYCLRLQGLLSPTFDREFKRYLRDSGIEVDNSIFELRFFPPQNFTKYRQIELDTAQLSVYAQVADNRKISERLKFRRYLGWTDDEILENERMWREENPRKGKNPAGQTAAEEQPGGDLGSIGLRPPPMGDDLGMEPPFGAGADPVAGGGGDLGAGAGAAGGDPGAGAPGVNINPVGGGGI